MSRIPNESLNEVLVTTFIGWIFLRETGPYLIVKGNMVQNMYANKYKIYKYIKSLAEKYSDFAVISIFYNYSKVLRRRDESAATYFYLDHFLFLDDPRRRPNVNIFQNIEF